MRHLTRTARTAAAIAAAALLATGCGLGGTTVDAETASSGGGPVTPEASDDGTQKDDDTAGEVAPVESATDDLEPGQVGAGDGPVVDDERVPSAADEGLPPAANPTGAPLVSAEGSMPYIGLDILDLRRDGDTLTLEFTVRTGATDEYIGAQDVFAATPDQFLGSRSQGNESIATGDPVRQTVSGVTLVDRDNANRHLVLRDSSGACLCSQFADASLEPEESYRLSAQFPAPPADVTSMTVEVPSFPSIDGVPIRDAG